MRAVEFKARIDKNQILIPSKIQEQLKVTDENVRVIILLDDSDSFEDVAYNDLVSKEFLKGFEDTDSIYDNRKS